ncbi:2-isopropylmalate synthase [Rhodococcus zopfii]|uniref:2-isopropylmalate synthase n=1 Tax=Rhodococcus zopfii TaxID=43772 RepID=UPI001F10824B|nr:2-isopropylmalate synthase [Rhodococcus zopfii]
MNAFTSFASDRRPAATRPFGFCTDSDRLSSLDPFAARYGRVLPLALRAEAAGMSWADFAATYAPQDGPLRLGGWSTTVLAGGLCAYEARFALGGTVHSGAAVATGPVSAMTGMIHELGFRLEIRSFHRQDMGDTHATFLLCESDDERSGWVMGLGATAAESTLRAMTAGINRLYGTR